MKTKQCSKCKRVKSVSEFSKDKRYKDNYKNWCKECKKEYDKNHYQNNKEKILESHLFVEKNLKILEILI